jgi:anti-sigma factor ChrR (cupin superfamily)
MPSLPQHDQPSLETANLASLYVLGTLTEAERLDFEQHLADGCPICTAEVEKVILLVRALAESTDAAVIEADMRERFLRRLQDEQTKDGRPAGILFHKSGVLIERTENIEWQVGPFPGIWVKPLFRDRQQQRATSLVRMEPGTHYPSHHHKGYEELFLLEGDFVIEGLVMRAGDYCHAQATSIHAESYTAAGCLFILSASQLDQVLS